MDLVKAPQLISCAVASPLLDIGAIAGCIVSDIETLAGVVADNVVVPPAS